MADISKIQILDGTYNVKDATARNNIGTLSNLNTSDKSNLVNAINSMSPAGKKFIFIGDSYGELSGQDTWIDVFIANLGLTNSNYYRNTLGSTGFKNYNASTNKRFIDLLEDVADDLSSSEKSAITDIIVGGGANDTAYSTASEIETYIEAFMTYAKNTFPNAKVYVAMLGFTMNPTNKKNVINVITAYNNVIKYGGYFLKGCENVIHDYRYFIKNNKWPTSDQVHPNQAGSSAIGKAVTDAYLNGYASVHTIFENNATDIGYTGLYSVQNNDSYNMYLTDELTLTFSNSSWVASPSHSVNICDFAPTTIGGFSSSNYISQCRVLLRTLTEDVYIDGWLKLECYVSVDEIRNKIVFVPNVYDTVSGQGSGGYKVYEDTRYLILLPQTLTFTTGTC